MTEIIRSWLCQNMRCQQEFTAWENYPACPECGSVRTQWLPGGGHVFTEAAKTADQELKNLAASFDLTNINSARAGERAKPALHQAPTAGRNAPNMQFAPGFTAPIAANGAAQCMPSTSRVNFKTRVGTGNALAKSRSVPGVHSATAIEASYRPPR